MKNKKVSVMVITPVYCTGSNKRLPLLLQSIYWVQQQTCKDRIHVIVDDGSTDQTPKLLDKIALNNPSIIVYHKKNGGESSAINFGIKKALMRFNPEYITISHSDDLLSPSSVEDRIRLAKKTGAKMVYSDSIVFYESRKPYLRPYYLVSAVNYKDSKILYYALLKFKHIPFATMLWEKDFFIKHLKGYDKKLRACHDWDIALRSARALCKTGFKFSVLHKVTAARRIHDNNISWAVIKDGRRWAGYKKILAKHLKGKEYYFHLAKGMKEKGYYSHLARGAFRFLKFHTPKIILNITSMVREPQNILILILPERIIKPLRHLRNIIMPLPRQPYGPYRNNWIESIKKIDYHSELIPK